jgi:REP element-mobilizing transposase RayT
MNADPIDPHQRHRRSIRLRDYDYAQVGAYFVTVCAQNRDCLFGEVMNGEVRLNSFGRIVAECWNAISKHFPNVELDESVVMPNHVHGIIIITLDVRRGEAFALAVVESRASVYANASPLRKAIIMDLNDYLTSTFSIAAHDPGAQEWGVAVESKAFIVGGIVAWAQAGVGAIATQAWTSSKKR